MGIISKIKNLTEPESHLIERGYVAIRRGPLTWEYRRPHRPTPDTSAAGEQAPEHVGSTR